MACRIQYALPTTPNSPLKCTHSDVLHHNPTFMCIYAVLLYIGLEALTAMNTHTALHFVDHASCNDSW